jgi:hypothetical protein
MPPLHTTAAWATCPTRPTCQPLFLCAGPACHESFPQISPRVGCLPLLRIGTDRPRESRPRRALQSVLSTLVTTTHALPARTRLFMSKCPLPSAHRYRSPIAAAATHWPTPRRCAHHSDKPIKANGSLQNWCGLQIFAILPASRCVLLVARVTRHWCFLWR